MKKAVAVLLILIAAVLVTGCANTGSSTTGTRDVRSQTAKSSIESTLVKEISGGKLVEVYDEYVRLSPGETGENWMIIKNVKDAGDTFSIQPCQGCGFDNTIIDISMGKYTIIKFSVSSDAGEKEIRIKDSHNNAYGFAKFNVIVE